MLFTATDKDRVEPTPKVYRPLFMQPIKDKIRFSSNISKGAYIKHRLLLYLSKQTFKKSSVIYTLGEYIKSPFTSIIYNSTNAAALTNQRYTYIENLNFVSKTSELKLFFRPETV